MCFSEIAEASIELTSIFREGQWLQKELVHRPRSELLQAMEIEAACCIRQADRFAYQKAGFEQRTNLEIPVPFQIHRFSWPGTSEKMWQQSVHRSRQGL